MKYIFLLIISILVIWMIPNHSSAQENKPLSTYTEEVNERRKSDQFSSVVIENKHGNISVNAWEKDSVRIDASINIKGKDKESVEEILKLIKIDFSDDQKILHFKTQFNEDFYSHYPFEVNYDIYMPSNHSLKIINRFGDIEIDSMAGQLDIDLEYGKLTQEGLGLVESFNSRLSFANANLGSFLKAKIELSNSTINIQNVEDGVVTGKYCQLDIARAGKLKIDSTTGRFNIGKVTDLHLTGDFSYVSIDEIVEKGNVEIQNGLLIIRSTSQQLKKLTVYNDNAPLNISIPSELSYSLHGEVSNGHFRHFQAEHFQIIKDLDKISISGTRGENSHNKSLVLFNKNAGISIEKQKTN